MTVSINHLALLIRESIAKFKHKDALCSSDSSKKGISFLEMGKMIDSISKALLDENIEVNDTVGIFSANQPEWTISDYAIQSIRAVSVPIYTTDSEIRVKYIIDETEMKIIFVGNHEQYKKVLEIYNEKYPIRLVIVFDSSTALESKIPSIYFKDFLELGEKSLKNDLLNERLESALATDLATIIYTSGTTGEPKGVMLHQSNFTQAISIHENRIPITSNDLSLSFLPLSHVYERTWVYVILNKGITNYYLENPREVIQVLPQVKPTVMCCVPRFFEKTYAFIMNEINSGSVLRKKIFEWAVKTGNEWFEKKRNKKPYNFSLLVRFFVAENLVLKRLREHFGGRINFLPCAGASIPIDVNAFFQSIGIFVLVGYGLTETTATVAAYTLDNFSLNSVGKPMPSIEVKIDNSGEILIKGETITSGYLKKQKETEASFENGWFKTGDKGYFNPNGELVFEGRIKEIIKTSVGKFVAPQALETKLETDNFIDQVIVVGDNKKFISALIVPDFNSLEEYAKKQNIEYHSLDFLFTHPEIQELYRSRIEKHQQGMASYEKVKQYALLNRAFSIESGELTSTYKLKRDIINKNYSHLIDSFYKES